MSVESKRFDMTKAAAYVAKKTGAPRPHRATILRWATRGIRGCKLRAEPVGARWYTSPEDVDEFLRQTAAAAAWHDAPAGPVRAGQITSAIAELDAELEGTGRRKRRGAPR